MSNLDFNRTFGGLAPTAGAPAAAGNRKPDAQTWMNIGYVVPVTKVVNGEEVTVDQFISTPSGIALDTMDPAPKRGNNAEFNALIDAKNAFMRKLQEAAATLAPGEERIISQCKTTGLCIQLRRVHDKAAETPVDQNPFMATGVKLPF